MPTASHVQLGENAAKKPDPGTFLQARGLFESWDQFLNHFENKMTKRFCAVFNGTKTGYCIIDTHWSKFSDEQAFLQDEVLEIIDVINTHPGAVTLKWKPITY